MIMKKVALTAQQLDSPTGQELLRLTTQAASDGKLDLREIKELRRWLRDNQNNASIPAITYLNDIMTRVAADGVIDRDELIELHLAIERVIPTTHRADAKQARKVRESAARERVREKQRAEKALEKAQLRDDRQNQRAEEEKIRNRLQHDFAKVSGVTFPNSNGVERQSIIRNCRSGDRLILQHDPDNPYSDYATKMMWEKRGIFGRSFHQIGNAPEYLAERLCAASWTGKQIDAFVANTTGGTRDKPTRGVNFVVIISENEVPDAERQRYIKQVLANRTS